MSLRPQESVWSAFRIAIKPTALAEVAARLRPRGAFVAGVLGAALATFLPLAAIAGSIAEPYLGFADYVRESIRAAPLVIAFIVVPFWFVVFGAIFIGSTIASSPRTRFTSKLCALSPLTVLCPALLWSVGAALNVFSHPNMGYVGPTGKPPWLDSPFIDVWGSVAWFVVLIAVAVGFGIHAAQRFGEFAEDEEFPACAFCRYNLTGNISGVCPECGEAIVAPGSPSGSTE